MSHWSTQHDMVAMLFKRMPGNAGTFMHAAIGMAGEATEIFLANTRPNLILELGDLEFYIEAAWQAIDGVPSERGFHLSPRTFGGASDYIGDLMIIAGDLLDIGKKAWVYEKELDKTTASARLIELGMALDGLYELLGVTREGVLTANIEKLSKRYTEGKYTDAAAQAKVDQCSECGADLTDVGCPHGH